MHTHKKKWQWVLHGTIVAKITLVHGMSWRQRVACCDLSWEHAQLQLLDDTNYCLPEHICKTLCQFGSYKEIFSKYANFQIKTDSHSSPSQGPRGPCSTIRSISRFLPGRTLLSQRSGGWSRTELAGSSAPWLHGTGWSGHFPDSTPVERKG